MTSKYTVSLEKIVKEFSLKVLNAPAPLAEIMISSNEINRPGLQMAGYYEFFDERRIQIIGKAEESFIGHFTSEKAEQRIRDFFLKKPSAVVVCRDLEFGDKYIEIAKECGIPLLQTGESTSAFSAALIAFLNLNLAPRMTQHGVLVEVYGEGILLMGDSGVGKSETAIELVKRGHPPYSSL